MLPRIREPQKRVSRIYYNLEKINNGDIEKKNDGNLKINLENDNLEKAVGNLFWTPTIPVMNLSHVDSHNSGCELPQ